MSLDKGTLIYANLTAKVKDTNEAVDTTREEDAKKMNVFDATRKYEPRLFAVGDGWLLSGLDDEVRKMDAGQRKEIELSPEKAFGQRDPTQTRMVPLRKFGDREHELGVGDSVDIDNRVGIVRFIGSGRAQVDFNHRLAGKTIVYDFEVVKKVEGDEEKLRALVDRRFGDEGSKVNFSFKEDDVEVVVPEEMFLTDGLQIIKRGLSADVFKYVPRVANITFEEKFVNKTPEKPAEKEPEEAAAKTSEHEKTAERKPRRKKQAVEAKA
ncbi:MAG: FKBP-type peptidyl-prolyl cis-trans isomerase [Thaumarchaeota archaeon]|nr:FKBP-type peptidyl-prolyl cis-trans isomerase [Nitrososphaerota archaeon]